VGVTLGFSLKMNGYCGVRGFFARVTAVTVALHPVGVGGNLSRVNFFRFCAKKEAVAAGLF
jgi:hypothetical protein